MIFIPELQELHFFQVIQLLWGQRFQLNLD